MSSVSWVYSLGPGASIQFKTQSTEPRGNDLYLIQYTLDHDRPYTLHRNLRVYKSLAKEFSKILTFEYFEYLKIGFDVFFDADSESTRMT